MADLRGTLKRFEPLDRDTKTFATLLATRQRNIRRAIHNLNLVANSLGGVEGQLASLVRASDTNFTAIAANDTQLESALTQFPATLRQTHLDARQGAGVRRRQRHHAARSSSRSRTTSGPALKASRPLFRDTTPVIANQLRPFSVAVQPLARDAGAGGRASSRPRSPSLSQVGLACSTRCSTSSPTSPEGQQSYLFWGAWLAHIADSLVGAQDANGAVLQGLFMGTCAELNFYENALAAQQPEPLGVILNLLNPPAGCPAARRQARSPARRS